MFEAPILDPVRFTAQDEVVEGHGFPGDLERLRGVLHSAEGEIHYRIRGGRGPDGSPMITIHVDGRVMLTCRRCLEGVPFALEINDRLVMVKEEAALPDLEDEEAGIDAIVQPERLSVVEILEEEILLALPLAPCHNAGECGVSREAPQQKRENPFAVLGKLKPTSST